MFRTSLHKHRSIIHTGLWMFVALLAMGLLEWIHEDLTHQRPASAAGGSALQKRELPRWQELTFYTAEHLFAVVFVAMLIRLWIERQAQDEAVSSVRAAVHEQVDKAFRDVNSQVDEFNKRVTESNAALSEIDNRLSLIQRITGGRLYAGKLRPEDQKEISNTFLNPPFFRPKYTIKITLRPNEYEGVTVEIDCEHVQENISDDIQQLNLSGFLDDLTFQGGPSRIDLRSKFLRFEYGTDDEIGRRNARNQPLIINEENLRRDSSSVRFYYETGVGIPPGGSYFIRMIAQQQMRNSDFLLWIVTTATDVFTFQVNLAGSLTTDDFALIARPLHHRQYDSFEPIISEDKKQLTWKLNGIVLPYQGFQLWWSPKAHASPKPSEVTV